MLGFGWSAEVSSKYSSELLRILKKIDELMSRSTQYKVLSDTELMIYFIPHLTIDGPMKKPRERRWVNKKKSKIEFRPNLSSKEWERADHKARRLMVLDSFSEICDLVERLDLEKAQIHEVIRFIRDDVVGELKSANNEGRETAGG